MSDSNTNSSLNAAGNQWLGNLKTNLDDEAVKQLDSAIKSSKFLAEEINAAGEANLGVSFDKNSAGILYNSGDEKVHIGSDLSGWEAQGLTAAPIAHELAHALQINGNPDNVSVPDQGIDGALEKSHTEEGVAYAAQYIVEQQAGLSDGLINTKQQSLTSTLSAFAQQNGIDVSNLGFDPNPPSVSADQQLASVAGEWSALANPSNAPNLTYDQSTVV